MCWGSTVVLWSALSPWSKTDLSLNLRVNGCRTVLSVYIRFPPPSKSMHVRLIGHSRCVCLMCEWLCMSVLWQTSNLSRLYPAWSYSKTSSLIFYFSFIVISTNMYVTHSQKGDGVPDGAMCNAVINAKKQNHCSLLLKCVKLEMDNTDVRCVVNSSKGTQWLQFILNMTLFEVVEVI